MKKILVIENTAKERDRAKAALTVAGYEPVVTHNSEGAIELAHDPDIQAIITDMFFPPTNVSDENLAHYTAEEPPMGLCMVILAMGLGKPVVICTDGFHHGPKIAFFYDGLISRLSRIAYNATGYLDDDWWANNMMFGWVESKDWERAVCAITARLTQHR